MTVTADRHLLYGLLALQNGFIDQGQLVLAFQAWTLEKSRSLADHLEARGDLTAARRALLEALAGVHLEAHGGDVEKSLATVSAGESTRERLARIGDPDIDATLDHVGSTRGLAEDGKISRTTSFAVGSATSDGHRFRVLRPHARGGLGEVFVALDGELNREVALKQILDHHADETLSRTRFLIEAEITGGLEHPGIVPVYGLGHYNDGRPYYAMRFIRGDSLKEAIAAFHGDGALKTDPGKRSLALRKLLRRFGDVCNAIDYAHGRGVLHRDLKPGNVIVGKHGETLVIDWGLAKPMGRAEPGTTTAEHALILSSASGSAETLPGSAMGTPAYMSPEQASGDLEQLGARSDVYSLGATLYCLLTGRPPFEGKDLGVVLSEVRRGAFPPPRQADSSIDRALEVVCLKAMALKPEDRHTTARALADDIERWMADEPVTAWREPFARRARRWLRRRRTAVTAAAAAVLVAVVGLAAVLAVQANANGNLSRKNGELTRALGREAEANANLTRANVDLAAAKDREAARFALAKDAIRLFHGEVGDDLVLKEGRFKPLRDRLLQGAADFYGKLEELLAGQSDPASRRSLGQAYSDLGDLTSTIGDKPKALEAHRKALVVRRELAAGEGASADARAEVAESLHEIARLLSETGRKPEALADFERALAILDGLDASGRVRSRQRVLAGDVSREIGLILSEMGNLTGARLAYDRSVASLTRLVEANPTTARYRSTLADSYHNLAYLQFQMGLPAESLESNRRSLAIREELAKGNPAIMKYRSDPAISHNNIGILHSRTGHPAEALESYRRAVAILEELARDNPAVTRYRFGLASSHNNIGVHLMETAHPAEALDSYRRSVAILEELARDNPAVTRYRSVLAGGHDNIGNVLYWMGRPAEAVPEQEQARVIFQSLVDANPTIPGYRHDLASAHTNLADSLRALGRAVDAIAGYGRAVAILEGLVQEDASTTYRGHLARSVRRLGLSRRAAGDSAGAIADTRRAQALLEKLPCSSGEEWYELACCRATLAGLAGEGEAGGDRAMELLLRAVANGYSDAGAMNREAALDLLRSRSDFRLLIMDLEWPASPFAR
jgi:eukaryotic-like serine/threonine-protein kinase